MISRSEGSGQLLLFWLCCVPSCLAQRTHLQYVIVSVHVAITEHQKHQLWRIVSVLQAVTGRDMSWDCIACQILRYRTIQSIVESLEMHRPCAGGVYHVTVTVISNLWQSCAVLRLSYQLWYCLRASGWAKSNRYSIKLYIVKLI